LHEWGVEVEESAAGKLVDHPGERDILDLLIGIAASHVAVVAGEPALD
jgi:ribosomal protein L12E/L44/L45/RPP1/RPP2